MDAPQPEPRLVPARDEHSAGWISLIGRVFAEYPGCVLDVEREEPELLAPASRFERAWTLEQDGRVIGTIALATHERAGATLVELKKCYLEREARGRGLGRLLIETVVDAARATGADCVELWSDTRFETAHAVYERLGFHRTGRTRALHDLSGTIEFEFVKALDGPGGGA